MSSGSKGPGMGHQQQAVDIQTEEVLLANGVAEHPAVSTGPRRPHPQPCTATAPLPPPLGSPLPWATLLDLCVGQLLDQESRCAVRLACKEWRSAADQYWTAGCFDCTLAAATGGSWQLVEAFHRTGTFLLPSLHELCLSGLQRSGDLALLLQQLEPGTVPALRRLALSAALGRQLGDCGGLAQLRLPHLQQLQTDGIVMAGSLASLTHLQQLTELSVGLTTAGAAGGGDGGGGGDGAAATVSVTGVAHLASLHRLKALSLPQLQDTEREALSELVGLTRLSFAAAGKGAVGPSLLPLTRLRHLAISLAHSHEHFLVLHPAVDLGALRALSTLRRLAVCHLAANSFFAAPEVTWSDEAPAGRQADLLVTALPHIEHLQLRLSYCRLAEDHASNGAAQELPIPSPTGHPRLYLRTIERVPVRRPGNRQADSWYGAWWQPAVQAQLAAAEEAAAAAGAASAPAGGGTLSAAQQYQADATEMAGWVRIRAGVRKTFDVLVDYALQ